MSVTTTGSDGVTVGPIARLVAPWCARLGSSLISAGRALVKKACPAAGEQGTGADRFASLASMIPGVVYQRIVKPDGAIHYTYISEGSREIFGVAPEEVLQDSEALFRTYSDEYKANFRRRLLDASRALTKWDVEASIVTPDGKTRFTHAIAKPERLADGSVLWTGLILDATRIKQAEEELKAANRSVEAANQAKSLFLANMSHEIRTPMNGVLGMADLLLKTELNHRQHRLLSTLKHSAQTLLGIINDVLDISRIEAGHFRLESEEFNLRLCLEDAIDLCAGAAYQKGLELNMIVEGDLPVIVKGDGGRLRQVLINLVGNAVKFTETGDATLRATSTPQPCGRTLVTIEVIDTGIGIAPAAKEKLFAPFAQADSSISRKFGGTGLGLAITRHLVTLMGGEVDLDSEIGRGTKVTVKLPLDVVQANDDTLARQLKGRRILVVDDRSRVRMSIACKLRGTAAEIAAAASEQEAFNMLAAAAARRRPFDAVIVDRLRAGADSIAFTRRLQAEAGLARTKVVNIVSMNWKGESQPPTGAMPLNVIAKPVRRLDLLEMLASEPAGGAGTDRETSSPIAEATFALPRLPLRILLAEDNPVNQEVAREYLSSFGCTVEIVQNGEEAVQALGESRFDLVLMDCQMPVLDGLSAVRLIRAGEQQTGGPRVPIIAVTANAYESDRIECLEAGMDDYLVKPFSEVALSAMLEKWRSASPLKAA